MCEDYRFKVNYFSEDGKIRMDLFSDEAEKVVKCFIAKYNAPKISDNKLQEDLSTWIEYEEIKKEGKYHEQETQKL